MTDIGKEASIARFGSPDERPAEIRRLIAICVAHVLNSVGGANRVFYKQIDAT